LSIIVKKDKFAYLLLETKMVKSSDVEIQENQPKMGNIFDKQMMSEY